MRKPRQEEQRKRVRIGALVGKAFCACALVAAMAPVTALAVEGVDAETSGISATAGLIAQDDQAKVAYGGNVTASLTSAEQVTVTGIDGYTQGRGPTATKYDGMTNPKATVTCGDTVYANSVAISEGAITISGDIVAATYTVVISSDNYEDKTVTFDYPVPTTVTLGGVGYCYLNADSDLALLDDAKKQAALANYTQIGSSSIYYTAADTSTALSGTLYGMDMSTSTAYSTLYNSLIGGEGATAADYDTVTSATGMVNNHHYGQLSELVARTIGSADASDPDANFITGAYCTPATIEGENAAAYVEAKILEAAGKDLTDAQTALAAVRLNGNATVDPATVKDRVAVDTETTSGFVTGCTYFDPTALTNSKVYGDLKLVIRPKAGANTAGGAEFSWDDYYQSLYAGTISDGTTTVGMAPWIDLYCEDHHFAVEMSIGNGTNPYNTSNMAEVNRFASLYDSASGRLKAGDYTVTLYAAGYNNLKYTFKVGAAVPSEDLKSVEIQNAELSDGATATVSAYSADLPKNELKGRGGTNPSAAGDGEVYAQDVAVANGKVELTRMLDAGDYKVVADGYTYTFTVSAESATAAAEKAAAAASETLAAVDSSNEDSVTAARAAYDALSDEAKAKVDASAVAKLEAAEKAVADAKAAAKAAAEKAAAEKAAAAKAAALAAASTVNKATVTAADVKKASDLGASTITLGPKVKKIAKKAFKGTNITTIVAKTKKLKKKSVKGSLKGSKVQLVKVQIGKKKVNKKFVKKYKKIFTKKVAGKKAKVKA